MRINPSRVDRVFVIGLSCLGDMLLASAALWNLRLFLPKAKFMVMVGPRALGAVKDDPMWDHVVVYDRSGDYAGLRGRVRLICQMRSFEPDLVIDLRSGITPLFSGAIYAPLWGIREITLSRRINEAERALRCMASIGVPIVTRMMRFYVSREAMSWADDFLSCRVPLAVLNPGAADRFNRWPADRFLQVGQWLIRSGFFVGVIGKNPDEIPMGDLILSHLGERGVDMRSLPSLQALGAILSRARLFVSNDTGPLHLASAVGTPTVGIYASPYLADRYGPWQNRHFCVLPKLPVEDEPTGQHRMDMLCSIGVGEVMDACSHVLGDRGI